MDYKRKIDFAIKLLRSIPKDGQIEVSYSGGKDSDVILELAKMAGIDYRAIYKQTGIDPSGTIQHAREMGAEVLRPKMSFYEIICKKGWPSCGQEGGYLFDRLPDDMNRDKCFEIIEAIVGICSVIWLCVLTLGMLVGVCYLVYLAF